MLNDMVTNNLNNRKPENPFVARQEGVVTNVIHSQAFLFGEDNMGKFKRTISPPCACGCGEHTTKGKLHPYNWNKFIHGHQRIGRKHSDTTKQKMSLVHTGRKNPEEIKQKMSISAIGKPKSVVTKLKMSIAKQNMSAVTKLKMSLAATGKKHSLERCKINSLAHKGQKLSAKTKQKLSIAKLGKKHPFYGKIDKDAPNWRGGIACEPYCEIWIDKEYKQSIRDRDNNECQNPDCRNNCNPNHALSLHHINYIKKDCGPWNLISLCRGCNVRAEGNKDFSKEWWQNLYQNIMTEKYRYKYEQV